MPPQRQLTPRQRELLLLALAAGYCVRLPDGTPPNLLWTVSAAAGPRSFSDRTGEVLCRDGLLRAVSSAGSMCRFAPTRAAWRLVARWRRRDGLSDVRLPQLAAFSRINRLQGLAAAQRV